MSVEVYWSSGSGFSWRVLLALEAKKIPYDSRQLEFSKGEHRSPEFLAINPRGRVPALRDGEVTVYESVAIIAYLDRRFPDPPLFGASPAESARVWRSVMETVNYLDVPTEAFILPLYFGRVAGQEEAIRAAIKTLHEEVARLETALAASSWLAGATMSAADLVAYPMVRSILRAAGKPAAAPFETGFLPLEARYPAVAAWMGRVEALPGYDRTYPPHWRAG